MPGLLLTAMFMAYIAMHAGEAEVAPVERGAQSVKEMTRRAARRRSLRGSDRRNDRKHLFGPGHADGSRCGRLRASDDHCRCSGANLTRCVLWHALQTTVRVCGNILFIVYAAFLFSYAISYAGVGEQITQFLVDLKLSQA